MAQIIRSPHKKEKRKKKQLLISAVFAVVSILFFVGFLWMTMSPAFQIKNVVVRGNEKFSSDEVVLFTKKYLSGKCWYFLPKSSIFFYSQEDLKKTLQRGFPRFENFSVHINDAKVLEISLSEREPVALWCGNEKLAISTDEKCYYLDRNGFVFGEAPTFSGGAYIKMYGQGDLLNENPIGENFVINNVFTKILSIHGVVSKYDKSILNIFLSEDGTLSFSGVKNCKILFDVDQSVEILQPNIDAVFSSPSWGGGGASEKRVTACENLEYLDFRFGNKIYYREKGKTPHVQNSSEQKTSTSTAQTVVPATERG